MKLEIPNLTHIFNWEYYELYLESDYESVWKDRGYGLYMESRFMHLTPEELDTLYTLLENSRDDLFIFEDEDFDGDTVEIVLEYQGTLDIGNYYEVLFEVI